MPQYDEENPSIEQQRKMLDDAEASQDPQPEPPPYIIMEDQQPERFAQMMAEGRPDGMESIDPTMKAILELPDKLAERLGAD